jgi:hypothetical protein
LGAFVEVAEEAVVWIVDEVEVVLVAAVVVKFRLGGLWGARGGGSEVRGEVGETAGK